MSAPIIDPDSRAFLEQARVARLATTGADGAPHLVPVVFALVDDAAYIVIDDKPKRTLRLRRLRNIAENPRAALLVDLYDEDWSRLRWLMLRGPAHIIHPNASGTGPAHTGPEHARAIAALRARYPQYASMAIDDRPVIRLTVESLSGWQAQPHAPNRTPEEER